MKYNKGFAPIIIALIIAGILVLGGSAYYLNKSSSNKNKVRLENKNTLPTDQNIPMSQEINIPVKNVETEKTPVESPKDNIAIQTDNNTQKKTKINCGNDLNCFITAANNCQESEVDIVKNNQNSYFGAVTIDTITHYEITGKEENNCISKNQITDFKYKFSEELKKDQTQDEIDYMEKEASKMFTETKYGYICKLDLSKNMGDILVRDLIKPTNLEWSMDSYYGSELACEYISNQ